MAVREVFIGSVGPFLYDDADVYDAYPAIGQRGIYVPVGRIRGNIVESDTAPSAPTEVVRLADLTGGSSILNPDIDDVTATRSIGTVYQNTSTDKWMIVMIYADVSD